METAHPPLKEKSYPQVVNKFVFVGELKTYPHYPHYPQPLHYH